jgi:serine/threonine-protein kinase RsbW
MHEGSITIRLPAHLENIDRLNRLVRKFGELHEIQSRALFSINLAMDEVVTNIVKHGLNGASEEVVVVHIEVAGSELRSEVVDGGREFNPLDAPAPDLDAPLEERELGGLGIHLVRTLMDRTEYRRDGGKNVLTMRKRIR